MKYLKLFNDFGLIEEARKWIVDPIGTQIEKFVNKYKGQEDKIFVSYRSGEYVSFINPKNYFNTPTGIYTYPWKGYFDERFYRAKNAALPDYRSIVPFTGGITSKFIYLYKVKDEVFLVKNDTSYDEILPYAKKLEKFFPGNSLLESYLKSEAEYVGASKNKFLKGHPCDDCLINMTFTKLEETFYTVQEIAKITKLSDSSIRRYIDKLSEKDKKSITKKENGNLLVNAVFVKKLTKNIDDKGNQKKCYNCEGTGFEIKYEHISSALTFWVLIFDLIDQTEVKGQKQTKFTNICKEIGVDGFVDLGDGYIHPNEDFQAVLLKGRSIMEDYVSISLDTDTQTIQLANTIINAKPIQLQSIIRNNPGDLSKIARYLQSENLLNDLIDKTIKSVDEMPDKAIIYALYLKGRNNKERKVNLKKEIVDFFKKLISYLPEEEQKKFEGKL
jgi:hypothetical protein